MFCCYYKPQQDMSDDIEQYLILAKGQRGRALQVLIGQVLSHKKIFTFGELLALESVQGLEGSEFTSTLATLELFAYGSYLDYVNNRDAFFDLTSEQEYKLKQLSIVSMAQESRILNYTDLMAAIDISTTRELEKIIMDAIFSGILDARLNQKDALLRVKDYIGRDVRDVDLPLVHDRLETFKAQVSKLIAIFQEASSTVGTHRATERQRMEELQKLVNNAKNETRAAMERGISARNI